MSFLSVNPLTANDDPTFNEFMGCNKNEVARVCHVFDHKRKACAETVPVYQLPQKSGYFFRSKLAVDVDGAPRAYHPKDLRPSRGNNTKALDWLDNVSSHDLHGIQGKDGIGPEPGFLSPLRH
jgi:hypothetical protein